MSVAAKITECRVAQNMSQAALANELRVTVATVANWERGRRVPSIKALLSISDALKVSPGKLLV